MDNQTLTPPQKLQKFLEDNRLTISLTGLFYPAVDGKIDTTNPQPQLVVVELPEEKTEKVDEPAEEANTN